MQLSASLKLVMHTRERSGASFEMDKESDKGHGLFRVKSKDIRGFKIMPLSDRESGRPGGTVRWANRTSCKLGCWQQTSS